jgi:diguanylate cyclase (GGDEF)-like protein/PAS domain S-box-containing protein
MSAFLASQERFLEFLGGLFFLLSAETIIRAGPCLPKPPAWRHILMAFAFLCAFLWIDIIFQSLSGSRLSIQARLMFLAGAAAYLAVFCLSGGRRRQRARWAEYSLGAVPVLGAVSVAFLLGADLAVPYLRYCIAALSIPAAIIMSRGHSAETAAWMRAAGLILAAYLVLALAAVPQGGSGLSSLINGISFREWAGFPVRLPLTILASALWCVLWLGPGRAARRMQESAGFRQPRTTWLAPLLIVIVAGGWLATERATATLDAHERQDLLNETAAAAAAFDPSSIASLGQGAGISVEYVRMKGMLRRIVMSDPGSSFAYLMVSRNGNIVILCDASPDGSDESEPGEVYEDATPKLRSLLESGGAAFVEGPVTDRWGTWISALVPISFPDYDKPIAVFGMDIDASGLQTALDQSRAGVLSVIILLCLVALIPATLSERIAKASARLAESEQRFRDLARSSSDWMWEVDPSGRYLFCSDSVRTVLGYEPADLIGRTPFEHMPPAERERVSALFRQLVASRQPMCDVENTCLSSDGREVCLLTNGVPFFAQDGSFRGYHGVDKDITARKKLESELRDLSLKDELTGLLNRRGLQTLGDHNLRLARRMMHKAVLLFADLDRMKEINDTLGHQAGDEALRATGEALCGCFRETDLVARVGGDEFVVLAVETAITREAMLERVECALRRLNGSGERAYPIMISAGLAIFEPSRPETLKELIDRADEQMYRDKESRRAARLRGAE